MCLISASSKESLEFFYYLILDQKFNRVKATPIDIPNARMSQNPASLGLLAIFEENTKYILRVMKNGNKTIHLPDLFLIYSSYVKVSQMHMITILHSKQFTSINPE